MKKKLLITIISIILILGIADITYLTAFKLNIFNEKFHKKEFEKYNVYSEFPDKDIDTINSEIILYLKGKTDSYNKELFNEEEITHLKDVKELIRKGNTIYYTYITILFLLILTLFQLNKKAFLKNLSITLFLSGALTLLVTVALLLLIKLNFSSFFTFFHNILFPQGGWLFSSSDNIIKLYPSGFFYDIAKKLFTSIILYGNLLILAAVSIFFYRKWTSQH